ncbi:hypothetical protein [uncultured Umboniibacter sp.]|uniref:hypothetical protein n=1 Tax=uncultured Umboniibacter sp. TaxID=1798917 RepID=UPI002627544D|nr:hypothetical protein [uncultured Umboniibacter sp.]
MSQILYFKPSIDQPSHQILRSRYRVELSEIEEFHKYLEAKIDALDVNTLDSKRLPTHNENLNGRMIINLVRLNHECKVALSGHASAFQLYQLLEKKDLYFQFGAAGNLRRTF